MANLGRCYLCILFLLVFGCKPLNYVTNPVGLITNAGVDWIEVCFKVVSGGPSEFGCNVFYIENHTFKIGQSWPRQQ